MNIKIGDRVAYKSDSTYDEGVVVRHHEEYDDKWWVKWDSDGCELHIYEESLSEPKKVEVEIHSPTSEEEAIKERLREAAKMCIDAGYLEKAVAILQLL